MTPFTIPSKKVTSVLIEHLKDIADINDDAAKILSKISWHNKHPYTITLSQSEIEVFEYVVEGLEETLHDWGEWLGIQSPYWG